MTKRRSSTMLVYMLLIFGILLITLPLYVTVVTTFKNAAESTASFFTLPGSFYMDNYQTILTNPKYWRALGNTAYITIVALLGNLLIMPAMSFAIARSYKTSRLYRYLYYFLLMGIFIPFQVRMMPLVKILSSLHLLNQTGVIVVYIAYATCESVFLYVGYLATVPVDMEEAAHIDGASTFKIYYLIALPMMKPMVATVLIREGLMMWNDFMLPLVTLNRNAQNWTLTIFQYNFQSEYTINYGLTFTCLVCSSLPIVLFYLIMQKQIIGGLTSGAVKA